MSANHVAVVTGGASGIGLGICQMFAANGHPLAMLDNNEELLQKEAKALEAERANIIARKVDVSNRAEVEAAYRDIRSQIGPIAIVVANAGISEASDFRTVSWEDWKRMIDVNFCTASSTPFSLPVRHDRGGMGTDRNNFVAGRAIGRSGPGALRGVKGRCHRPDPVTRARACTPRHHGKHRTALAGGHAADAIGLECRGNTTAGNAGADYPESLRPGTREDIAGAVEYLCSDKASYVTGQEINVNGGSWM